MFGQLIGHFDPAELTTRLCVVPRRHPLWFIKAARRDVDFVQEIFMLKGQLRATRGQKLRVPFAVDLNFVGSPHTSRN